jgi:hypothetical protein
MFALSSNTIALTLKVIDWPEERPVWVGYTGSRENNIPWALGAGSAHWKEDCPWKLGIVKLP